MTEPLLLKHASASRPSGEWSDDDFAVLSDGAVVGRIMRAAASPVDAPWLWTLAYGHHEDRTPTHGYEATREAAMAAFANSWRARVMAARWRGHRHCFVLGLFEPHGRATTRPTGIRIVPGFLADIFQFTPAVGWPHRLRAARYCRD
jgi:hypothetical protein